MEFPSLGERCGASNCQQLDFLPVSCAFCHVKFCKTHFLPFDHSCPNQGVIDDKPISSTPIELPSCALPTCHTKELVEMLCSHCQLHFCLQHRHQVDHDCVHMEKLQERMVQTAALIQQIQLKNAEKKPVRQGVKSDKLAAKVQLMKLKQHSKGLAELPVDERIYFLIRLPLSDQREESVFVSKLWSVGKCIDYIANICRVPNYNNMAGKPQLNLFAGHCFSSRKDAVLKDLIEQEIVFNGQSISLQYVE